MRRNGLNQARLADLPQAVPGAAHRFRIGIFEAAIVSDGKLTLPPASAIFRDLPAAALPGGATVVEQNCVLLDLGGHLVLIDNGMGSSTLFGPQAGCLTRSLAMVGVTPDQIDALVLTHAHPDHCWGTMRDDGTPAFANAAIYLARLEWDHWMARPAEDAGVAVAGFRRHLWPLRDRVVLFEDGEEFLPGLHAVASPGHTPGHSSLLIASAGEQAVLLGDVAFHHLLSFAFPQAHSAFDGDRAAAAATRLRLLAVLAEARMRVLHYHAPFPGIGHVARDGTRFGWHAED